LGRHRRRPWLAGADGGLRRDLRGVRRRDLDRRSARTEADIDALYEAFVPKNVAVAAAHAEVIPCVAEVVKQLRAEGVKIGSSTGYTREIMAEITPRAAEQGFAPTVWSAPATPAKADPVR
jgi:beta-phosphoglucomutase-like phosphatase (HAD superfamily)